MKNIFCFLALCTSIIFSQNSPIAGKKYHLEYDATAMKILSDSKEIKVVYAFDYWSTVGMPERGHTSLFNNVLNPDSGRRNEAVMVKQQSKWFADIDIPGDVALLSYYLTDGTKSDYNDEKTYVIYVCNEKGNPVKNARFRNVDFLFLAGKDTNEVIKEIRKEVTDYPDNFIAHYVYWRYRFFAAEDYSSLFKMKSEFEKQIGKAKIKFKNNIDLLASELRVYDLWTYAFSTLCYKNSEKLRTGFIKAYEDKPQESKSEFTEKLYKQYKKSKESEEFIDNIVGTKAPDFEFTSLDGKKMKLSDLKDKYVLLDFWGTWCGPCVAEIPNLVKVYNKFKNKGFEIISVSSDGLMNNKKEKDLTEYTKKNNMTWIHFLDNNTTNVHDLYKITSWPTLFLVDKDGMVIKNESVLRGNDLAKTLTELMGE